MLGLSSKTFYAVSAMHVLMRHDRTKPMKIKEIAKLANAPQNFLEQILLELRKKGILQSVKGANGGYLLAREPERIYLREIVETIEGAYFTPACKTEKPALQLLWQELCQKAADAFDIPLSELERYQQQIDRTLDFSI